MSALGRPRERCRTIITAIRVNVSLGFEKHLDNSLPPALSRQGERRSTLDIFRLDVSIGLEQQFVDGFEQQLDEFIVLL
jgi:hypothetical protein